MMKKQKKVIFWVIFLCLGLVTFLGFNVYTINESNNNELMYIINESDRQAILSVKQMINEFNSIVTKYAKEEHSILIMNGNNYTIQMSENENKTSNKLVNSESNSNISNDKKNKVSNDNKSNKNSNNNKSNKNSNLNKSEENIEYTDRIPILTFHRLVSDEVKKEFFSDDQWVGSVDRFEEMMKYLYENGYKTISTEEFYEWYIGKREYDKKTVLICFDDGFYEDYYLAYPIIKKYNFKATSFVVGSRIDYYTPPYNDDIDTYKMDITYYIGKDVIEKVRREYPNFEFQSHSYNMHYYSTKKLHRIETMTYEEMEQDVFMNEEYKFTTMAYPYGEFNSDIKKILKDNGYLVAFRFGPSKYARRSNDRFAIYRIKINGNADINTLKKWLNY